MVSKGKRSDIRKRYRALRVGADVAQWEVEAVARLGKGRYWKIENGVIAPTEDERKAIARVLRVEPSDLPFCEAVAS
jgi:transcriptional regulator with XRE-family HTH domain